MTDSGVVAVVAVAEISPLGGNIGVDEETVSAVTERSPDDSPLGASLAVETTELGPLLAAKFVEPKEYMDDIDRRLAPVSSSLPWGFVVSFELGTSTGAGREDPDDAETDSVA